MTQPKYSITFACYNQVKYTQQCVDSMVRHGLNLNNLIVVDNGSIDDTRRYLQTLPLGGCIFNNQNLGCGVAWNQGALTQQAEWTIIMNNDVVVSANWVDNLINVAIANNLKVISPALVEGEFDYDFDTFANKASVNLKNVIRIGHCHAVCLAIHKSVWMEVGYFQPVPKLLGYEDTMFFHELDKAGIAYGMTGGSWLHHFGSITQNAMKQERGLAQKDGLAYRYNYKLLQQGFIKRKLNKYQRNQRLKHWRDEEFKQFSQSIHGLRKDGQFKWV